MLRTRSGDLALTSGETVKFSVFEYKNKLFYCRGIRPPIGDQYPMREGVGNVMEAMSFALFGESNSWPLLKVAAILFQVTLFDEKNCVVDENFFPRGLWENFSRL